MTERSKLRPLPRLWDALDSLLALAAVAITGIVIYQIIARAAGMSIRWTEELARLVSIWVVFLGIPALILRRSLIRIEFFFDHMSQRVRRILLVAEFAITAGMLVFLATLTFKQVGETWVQTSAGLEWPNGVFTLPIALGALLGLFVMWHMRHQLLTPIPVGTVIDDVAKDTV